MANVDYQYNCCKLIINKNNLCEEFFDLKTGITAEIL